MSIQSLEVLFENLRRLAEAALKKAPESGGSVRRRVRSVFERHENGSATIFNRFEDEIDWPHVPLDEWIATIEPFGILRAQLAALDNIDKWMATRTTGPDQ